MLPVPRGGWSGRTPCPNRWQPGRRTTGHAGPGLPSTLVAVLTLALVLLPGLAAAAPAPSSDRTYRFSIIATSDLNGQLAPPDCREGGGGGRTIGHLAASLARAKREAEAEGRQVLTTLQLGDFTGTAALGRFVFNGHHGPERMARLAALTGVRHATIGNGWLDQDPSRLAVFSRELPRQGVEVLNTSIQCAKRPDCDALSELPSRTTLLDAPLRVVLIGATPESSLSVMDPTAREGLLIPPVAESLKQQANAARAEGADFVIAALRRHPGTVGDGLISRLSQELNGVDLLLSNQLAELPDSSAALLPTFGPAVAITGHAATSAVRIDFDLVRTRGRTRIVHLRSSPVIASAPDLALEGEARALVREYCATYERPLRVKAERAVLPREFLGTVLDEMRHVARAEVGVTNDDVVDRSVFPFFGTLSSADIFSAMPFDDAVVRAKVSGSRLRDMWNLEAERRKARRSRLVWTGITERDGTLLVNERPLNDSSSYTVVMPDYLARGGDSLLGSALDHEKVRWKDAERRGEVIEMRELVLHAFSDESREERSVLQRPPLDLEDKLRWTWSYGITLGANDTRRSNSAEYDDSRLLRNAASALRGSFSGQIEADTRDHALRLSTRARYAQNHVREPEQQVAELEDQIFTEALYRLRSLRRRFDQAWFAPVPYVSAVVDTEFFPAENASFRQLGVRSTMGVRLLPWGPLELKVGGGPRRELLDPSGRFTMGVEFGYDLPRFSPFSIRGMPVDFDSNFDYFISDFGKSGERRHEGRWRGSILLPLGGPFAVNAAADFFVYRREGGPFAWVSEFSLGLTIRFDGAHQRF